MGALKDSMTLYKREMLIFRSNLKTSIIRSIIFPLVIIVFFGNIGLSLSNTPVAVANYANNVQSRTFISDLQVNNYIKIVALTSEDGALSLLRAGKVQLVVIILPTFPSSNPSVPGVQVYYANTQFSVTGFVVPLINGIAAKFSSSIRQNTLLPPQRMPASTVSQNALYGSTGSYKDFLIGGVIGMVIIFGAIFAGGISLISDRQLGNLKAFFITPIDKNAIILSRIMSGGTQSVLFALIALGVGLANGVHIAMWPFGLVYIAAASILLGMIFSSVAVMLASRINKVDTYAIASQAFALPTWFISGGIVPIGSLPSWLAPFSVIDPLTYSNEINRAVILQGFISLNTALIDYGVLVLFAAVFLFASFRFFKVSIE